MKIIITLILVFSFVSVSNAATLSLSLQSQMVRQTVINKRNALTEKRLEKQRAIAARKEANRQRLALLKMKNSWSSTSISSTVKVASTVTTTKTPTITAPKIQPVQSNTQVAVSVPTTQNTIANVDISRIRSSWLSWYNNGRAAKWLGAYSYDSRLDSTAHDWNIVFAGSRGTNYHERSPGDGYYNYPIINKWFQDRGVNPPVISRVNHSENVSYGYYNCTSSDCTDALISAMYSSYKFFINSSVHAKSVYQPNFTKIGFDIIVVPSEKRYYVTVHYMTK